ncbi:MAG: dipeptidase [Thermomicrobiales bacterium]
MSDGHGQGVISIFDGHNDTVLSLRRTGRSFFAQSGQGHVDLPRAKTGGLVGGFFAVFVEDRSHAIGDELDIRAYEDASTMPPMMSTEYAQSQALAALGTLLRLEAESDGAVKIVRTAAEVRDCIECGVFAVELHFEGAEPIDEGLEALETFHAAGLRSIGLVWSRPNRFARGVPFKHFSSPDIGAGLTDAGKALVKACNRLGIMLDVSHLNEAGFWDLAKISDAPIVATHCNVHAISPSSRNLLGTQLDAIRDSEGLVGINFNVGFLRPDGVDDVADTTVAAIVDHADAMIERMGVDCVALGSDFDGATMPGDLKDAAGLQLIVAEMRRRGYDEPSLRKIGFENWLRIFERTWRE